MTSLTHINIRFGQSSVFISNRSKVEIWEWGLVKLYSHRNVGKHFKNVFWSLAIHYSLSIKNSINTLL